MAIELHDDRSLAEAMQQLVRECRLAEMALINANAVDAWTGENRR
jgi:hypothetical protein